MNDCECECGAHWMQTCDWWCGQGLTSEEIWERENHELAETRKLRLEIAELRLEIAELKDLIKSKEC